MLRISQHGHSASPDVGSVLFLELVAILGVEHPCAASRRRGSAQTDVRGLPSAASHPAGGPSEFDDLELFFGAIQIESCSGLETVGATAGRHAKSDENNRAHTFHVYDEK